LLLLHVFLPVASLLQNRLGGIFLDDLLASLLFDTLPLIVDGLVEPALFDLLAAGHGVIGAESGLSGSFLLDEILLQGEVVLHLLDLLTNGFVHLVLLFLEGGDLLCHLGLDVVLHLPVLFSLVLGGLDLLLSCLELGFEGGGLLLLLRELIFKALFVVLGLRQTGSDLRRFALEVRDVSFGLVKTRGGIL
jgi:hypothetical protein